MTKEEKELLLKDICARLPYGVKGLRSYSDDIVEIYDITPKCEINSNIGQGTFTELCFTNLDCCSIGDFKPYLRPMSSMTEEERAEYFLLKHRDNDRDDNIILIDEASTLIDWLNAHHFDYRGLIEKGLALEAPEGMY